MGLREPFLEAAGSDLFKSPKARYSVEGMSPTMQEGGLSRKPDSGLL
jgi:hypothetical protein